MAVKLPTVADQRTQQALDAIGRLFPLGRQLLANASVGTPQIKDLAVTAAKIALATITDDRLAKPVIVGSVTSAGAVETGSGFTAKKTGTGLYTVTLDNELPTTGIAIPTPQSNNRAIRNSEKGKQVFKFACVDMAEVAADTSFSFSIKAS